MTSERRICTRSRARQDEANVPTNVNVRPVFELSKLPLEIQIIVFAIAAEDNKGLILLLAVCREWRNLIISSPALWRRLEVTRKTKKKKIDLWISRSKGRLSCLCPIRIGIRANSLASKVIGWFSKLPGDFWSGIETLEIESSEGFIYAMMRTGILKRLRLRNLYWNTFYVPGEVSRFLCDINTSRIQELSFRMGSAKQWRLSDLAFTSLTSLQISGEFGEDLFVMLDRNPSLTRLSLIRSFRSYGVCEPRHIELRHLIRLELYDYRDAILFIMPFLHTPNLQVLVLRGREDYTLRGSVEFVNCWELEHLQELHLHRCEFLPYDLKFLLKSVCNITTLSIHHRSFSYQAAEWLRTLNSSTDDSQEVSKAFFCPLLQYIKLSGFQNLDLNPVIQFVAERLHASSSEETSKTPPAGSPRRILSLRLEDCHPSPSPDPDGVAWLQANVPCFVYEVAPV